MKYAHTCYRVFDLDKSVDFYTNGLGFDEQRRIPIREEAINVFVTPPGSPDQPLELTYNFGREEPYEIGTGYGHIALYVDDMDGTLATLAEKGIQPEKPPYSIREGGSRLCFVRDPDGYRIELIEQGI
jgi:lactoylglutathione lyase